MILYLTIVYEYNIYEAFAQLASPRPIHQAPTRMMEKYDVINGYLRTGSNGTESRLA
jgi:hypothetical protein